MARNENLSRITTVRSVVFIACKDAAIAVDEACSIGVNEVYAYSLTLLVVLLGETNRQCGQTLKAGG